jgi:hypothetical protein
MSTSDEEIKLTDPDLIETVISEVVTETIQREEKPKKCMLKKDVHICFRCCAYSWAFSLNGCECCCGLFSDVCISMSKFALCCKSSLEMIDCDSH